MVAFSALVGGNSAEGTAGEIVEAYNEGDYELVGEFFSDEAKNDAFNEADAEDCDEYADYLAEESDGFVATMKLLSVRESGDTATAKISISVGMFSDTDDLLLVKEGGNWKLGSDKPSKDQFAAQLLDFGLTEDGADCAAEALLDSDLSEDQLNSIADDDDSDLSTDESSEVSDAIESARAECEE